MFQFSTPEIAKAAAKLGLSTQDLALCMQHPDISVCQQRLVELKARMKKNYRQCARELHPDRTGGDAEKEALFKDVVAVWSALSKMKIVRRPPPVRIVTVTPSGGMTFSSSTSTTTAWGGWQTWDGTR